MPRAGNDVFTSGSLQDLQMSVSGGATWATYFSSPSFLYGIPGNTRGAGNPQLGFRSGPPNIACQGYDVYPDADRCTGSVQFVNRPFSFLNHRLIVGIDRLAENNEDCTPRNDVIGSTYAAFSGRGLPTAGRITGSTRDVACPTVDYMANAEFTLLPSLRSVTSAGGQVYLRRSRFRSSSGTTFPAAGLASLASATVRNVGSDDVFENITVGGFAQQQFVFNDRLFVTGAIRTDDNSAFGTNFEAVTYPTLSASYVLTDEPSLPIPAFVNQRRVRSAFGGSGLQPGAFVLCRELHALPRALGHEHAVVASGLHDRGESRTDFPGIEPDASFNGGARGGTFGEWEQNVLPQLRPFVTTVYINS